MSPVLLNATIAMLDAMDDLSHAETCNARGERSPWKASQKEFIKSVRKFMKAANGTNHDFEALLASLGYAHLAHTQSTNSKPVGAA